MRKKKTKNTIKTIIEPFDDEDGGKNQTEMYKNKIFEIDNI